jgi:hypothetical protein
LRNIERPFAWLPCRLLTNGTLVSMSPTERQLYLVLALAADRRGVSFYADNRIEALIGCSADELNQARVSLIHRDLLAFDGSTYQLLALPTDTTPQPITPPRKDATPRQAQASTSVQEPQWAPMPEHVRATFRKLFGDDTF